MVERPLYRANTRDTLGYAYGIVVGAGLCFDQAHILTFGLGKQRVKSVFVTYLDGHFMNKLGSFANQPINL
jgi:hypothetical protein